MFEEHFETYSEAEDYVKSFSKEQQMDIQFFSKEWDIIDGNHLGTHKTDSAFDRAYLKLQGKPYRLLKTEYDNAIKKMFK